MTVSVTRDVRIVYHWINADTVEFLNIGWDCLGLQICARWVYNPVDTILKVFFEGKSYTESRGVCYFGGELIVGQAVNFPSNE